MADGDQFGDFGGFWTHCWDQFHFGQENNACDWPRVVLWVQNWPRQRAAGLCSGRMAMFVSAEASPASEGLQRQWSICPVLNGPNAYGRPARRLLPGPRSLWMCAASSEWSVRHGSIHIQHPALDMCNTFNQRRPFHLIPSSAWRPTIEGHNRDVSLHPIVKVELLFTVAALPTCIPENWADHLVHAGYIGSEHYSPFPPHQAAEAPHPQTTYFSTSTSCLAPRTFCFLLNSLFFCDTRILPWELLFCILQFLFQPHISPLKIFLAAELAPLATIPARRIRRKDLCQSTLLTKKWGRHPETQHHTNNHLYQPQTNQQSQIPYFGVFSSLL